ncbi:CheR family methyltransferase [Sphingomonas sp.]|uniref:CheR family methyltransferase n=1 Tax=Sphingomonas sp. TaxID=28214 RepID=UPI002BDE4808|nr:CheR family methyltransferase [Sphingomonas sp.]HTG38938.1 CheR family methyltransferase [Sphingomonas sp.]
MTLPNADIGYRAIVAIVASGGALDALQALVATLDDGGVAYLVCVSQAFSTDGELIEGIRQASHLPVLVADGRFPKSGTIQLMPVDRLATLTGDGVLLDPLPVGANDRGRADSFLVSVARLAGRRSIAVILKGVFTEGALGLAEIKQHDGLAIVEKSDAAEQQRELGRAAPALADYVLPVDSIAECMARFIASVETAPETSRNASGDLSRISTILQGRTGHDFHGYKLATFQRRVERRMQVTGHDSRSAYVEHLRQSPEETQRLFDDLLIGVTAFFRDPGEFAYLERHIIPRLFERAREAMSIRVWVLGCSTGEEAYSIAMLLKEHGAALGLKPRIQIFATDIDNRALAHARAGRYTEAVTAALSPERLARWFSKEGATYVVSDELRECCIFSQHSIVRDAPFSRIDLVSCRNLLIYMDRETQDRVIPMFHFALNPDGYLFLGTSETVSRHGRLFAPADRRSRVYQRRATMRARDAMLAIAQRTEAAPMGRSVRNDEPVASLTNRVQRVIERHAPAHAVIDHHYEVLHFSAGVGQYLDPASGAANLNFLNLIARDLRLDVRTLLQRVSATLTPETSRPVRFAANGAENCVTVAVEPLAGDDTGPDAFIVFFRNMETDRRTVDGNPASDTDTDELEDELRATRERLQATIEELESTNEELKSSLEEYQSLHEEMQSANEELGTSKEELQSVNEELQTVNGELANRVSELGRANSDLSNLLESTQIATIFLDTELRVKLFTPAVRDLFPLLEQDIGRSIEDIATHVRYPEMRRDCLRVLQTLGSVEHEVEAPATNKRYLARVLPYRSCDNFIAGVVLTFSDITEATRAEQALRASEERFRNLARSVDLFLFIGRRELDWSYINPRFFDYTGLSEDAALGEGWLQAIHPEDVTTIRESWVPGCFDPVEIKFRVRGIHGNYRWFLCRALPTVDDEGNHRWYGACTDIHSAHESEERMRFLMAELQHRVRNILAVVRSIFVRTAETSRGDNDLKAHFEGRLDALARTQNTLVRTPVTGVDLEEVVSAELMSHGGPDDRRIVVRGPRIRLRASAAESFGLLVHELVTNAAKYGALATNNGEVLVQWSTFDKGQGPHLVWEWIESGVAVVNPAPARSGFGRELIEHGLPYQLGGLSEIDFRPGGIRCRVELPLSDRVTVERDQENRPEDVVI